MHGLTNFK